MYMSECHFDIAYWAADVILKNQCLLHPPDNGDLKLRRLLMRMTHSLLAAMTGDEFEVHRAAGFRYRQELTRAVMNTLSLPDGWDMNGEYRGEFGGLFPIQVRFQPKNGLFQIVICSPGEISENWLIMVAMCQGQQVTCISQQAHFDAEKLNRVLRLTKSLEQDGYGVNHILSVLKESGAV